MSNILQQFKPETIEYIRTTVAPAIRNYDGTMPQHLQAGANAILALCEAFEEQQKEIERLRAQLVEAKMGLAAVENMTRDVAEKQRQLNKIRDSWPKGVA